MSDVEPTTIGWREWVLLPALGGAEVKAKIDTGARTSSLHAYDIAEIDRDGGPWLRFSFHPIQRDEQTVIAAEAPLVGRRRVTASNGQSEMRYVVETDLQLDGRAFPIELTLTRRDAMGFRMLIGRRAMRGRYVVDPRRSFRSTESKARRRRIRREERGRTGRTKRKEAAGA
jgi:hypothetical protein